MKEPRYQLLSEVELELLLALIRVLVEHSVAFKYAGFRSMDVIGLGPSEIREMLWTTLDYRTAQRGQTPERFEMFSTTDERKPMLRFERNGREDDCDKWTVTPVTTNDEQADQSVDEAGAGTGSAMPHHDAYTLQGNQG